MDSVPRHGPRASGATERIPAAYGSRAMAYPPTASLAGDLAAEANVGAGSHRRGSSTFWKTQGESAIYSVLMGTAGAMLLF
jgi:hypothetical protein